MKLSQFKFNLPDALIAKHPAKERHDSKLMIIDRKTQKIKHKKFKDILDIFGEEDVFVMNDTQVFPARLYGNKEKTGARIEVFLMRELNNEQRLWDVQVDPARKIRVGNKLFFGNDELVAEVVDNTTSRGRTIKFLNEINDAEFKRLIDKLGETPIPRYLGREADNEDKNRYQTVFAKKEGATAPPTAGLHFSKELMMRLEIKGIRFANVTLHIGQGTFREVEVEDLTKHKMDSEFMEIPERTVEIVNKALDDKRRIVAVGSSVMRALQTSVSSMDRLNPYTGWTDKFIFPPYDFKIANAFITNFHPSESTLLMMSAAFTNHDFMMEAYQVAMKEKYKFYCYGDAMLIL